MSLGVPSAQAGPSGPASLSGPAPREPRGRWAPTPSGHLHLGSARTALVAWWSIRRQGGAYVWRVEDLDPPRTVAGTAESALEDLAWLGIDWDEGPRRGGPHAPYVQSERSEIYERALERLAASGRLFPCRRSRRELRDLARAPDGTAERPQAPAYPIAWRPRDLEPDWYARRDAEAALRFRVEPGFETFDDLARGVERQDVAREVGDFVLRRRDGLYAYQLAVVVDDLEMGITEVVRGMDLLDSTGRQMQLARALGGEPPRFGHIPLLVSKDGAKLSKRLGSLELRTLREAGVRPEEIVGHLAHDLGLIDRFEPVPASDLIDSFDWNRLARDDTVIGPSRLEPDGWR